MVTKNFNVPLLDARGQECRENGQLLLVADCAISALTEPTPDDGGLTSSQKTNLWSLALRIGEATGPGKGPREYTPDELELIKTRASKNVRITAYARLCELIDAKDQPTAAAPGGEGEPK